MSTIRVTKRIESTGENPIQNPAMEVKTVRVPGWSSEPAAEASAPESVNSQSTTESNAPEAPISDAERRAKRKEEYRQSALVHQRAQAQLKQAEEKLKQVSQFSALMEQGKEDPVVLAKALGLTPEEFQRKLFNKMYSIKEEAPPVKEETFEEQTKRKLAEYEAERQAEKVRREEEIRQESLRAANDVKHRYIQNNIMPAITEQHEFILRNDKHSCAAFVYDLMNQAFQEHAAKGGTEADFSLRAEDVVNQMEEELEKQATSQMLEAKNISKLKKYFRDEEQDDLGLHRKEFGSSQRRQHTPSTTLSSSLGPSAPPSISSISSGLGSAPQKKIPLKDKNARREAAKRNLGGS